MKTMCRKNRSSPASVDVNLKVFWIQIHVRATAARRHLLKMLEDNLGIRWEFVAKDSRRDHRPIRNLRSQISGVFQHCDRFTFCQDGGPRTIRERSERR